MCVTSLPAIIFCDADCGIWPSRQCGLPTGTEKPVDCDEEALPWCSTKYGEYIGADREMERLEGRGWAFLTAESFYAMPATEADYERECIML